MVNYVKSLSKVDKHHSGNLIMVIFSGKLSRFTRNINVGDFTNNKRVGLKWALSLANPISCLGSVPRNLFKSFRAGEIL